PTLFEREDWSVTISELAAQAYGRAARTRRTLAQDLARTRDKLAHARQRADALELNRDEIRRDAASALQDLRNVLSQAANHSDALRHAKARAEREAGAARDRATQAERLLAVARQTEKALRSELAGQTAKRRGAELAVRSQKRRADTAERAAEESRHRLAQTSLALERKEVELHDAQETLEMMHRSNSWRITAPLRAGLRALREAPRAARGLLAGLKRKTFARLRQSHPRLAQKLHSVLRPEAAPPPEVVQQLKFQRPAPAAPYRPLVSVIVPNFNHAAFLRQRLDSILAQTYSHFELILLDDASTDDSVTILKEYEARDTRVRLLINQRNSGGAFRQWETGMKTARGELIWIAESDDWADPDFLERMVPFFQNEAVQLAFCRNVFVGPQGEPLKWTMEEYLADFDASRWSHEWIETASNIVRDVFSMANMVPNAGSALMRRMDRLDVLEAAQWRDMKVCGDWFIYLNVIRGGLVAYTPQTKAYYRVHPDGTSQRMRASDAFYREHELIAKALRRHYRLRDDNLARLETRLRQQWDRYRGDSSDAEFRACFDLRRILREPPRKPGLLMAGFAFAPGGGEVFPIHLANLMKADGYEVTFLDFGRARAEPGIRATLARDIPVVGNFHDLAQIVDALDIEIVHSHHGWVDNTVLDLLPRGSAAKTVVTMHGFYETMTADRAAETLPRLIARSGAIVHVAEKNLDPVRKQGLAASRRFQKIENRLPRLPFQPMCRAAMGVPADAFLLTLVSRALPEKGWAEAIASVARARAATGRDIRLALIGDGEARDSIIAGEVPDFIHMPGFKANPLDYFAAADLAILPSRFSGESAPLVVIEALSTGTPVLASDLGEVRQMLATPQGPAGMVVPLAAGRVDVGAFSDAIAALATDPLHLSRLADRARIAAERFEPAQMVRDYDTVYRETAKPQPTPAQLARAAR
ncbi:MAG: glycosyltransferase, partial [Paracoccus sp. (in: a-proteobacteria)]|nr:glycosyltransferase [Paracoccus sp. (in: a-proteobacteria)]